MISFDVFNLSHKCTIQDNYKEQIHCDREILNLWLGLDRYILLFLVS